MNDNYVLILGLRWLHILSATLAIGVPIYFRLVVMPALATLDEDSRTRLSEALSKRWKMFVHVLIVVFLATGLYNFLGVARQKNEPPFNADSRRAYQILFGIKFIVALAMFTISSALAGRAAVFAFVRKNAAMWLTILIVLGMVIVGLSGAMRFLPE